MTVKSTPDTLTWNIKKRDGSKEEILINKKESNKYSRKKRMVTDMGELSHLDELEAEAVYIIREVAAECEKPVMLLLNWKGPAR